jgi:hypothetical protein
VIAPPKAARSGRACTYDDRIEGVPRSPAVSGDDVVGCLASLGDRIANESHATKFTDDVDARQIRLKIGVDLGELEPPLGRAKDQANRVDRTGCCACAMADASQRVGQNTPAVDHREHALLGARIDAGTGADAAVRVDLRMNGGGNDVAHGTEFIELTSTRCRLPLLPFLEKEVHDPRKRDEKAK